jgi:hypothetical protein
MAIVFPKFIRRPLNLSSTTATQLFRLRFPQTECLDTARKILFPKISNFFLFFVSCNCRLPTD